MSRGDVNCGEHRSEDWAVRPAFTCGGGPGAFPCGEPHARHLFSARRVVFRPRPLSGGSAGNRPRPGHLQTRRLPARFYRGPPRIPQPEKPRIGDVFCDSQGSAADGPGRQGGSALSPLPPQRRGDAGTGLRAAGDRASAVSAISGALHPLRPRLAGGGETSDGRDRGGSRPAPGQRGHRKWLCGVGEKHSSKTGPARPAPESPWPDRLKSRAHPAARGGGTGRNGGFRTRDARSGRQSKKDSGILPAFGSAQRGPVNEGKAGRRNECCDDLRVPPRTRGEICRRSANPPAENSHNFVTIRRPTPNGCFPGSPPGSRCGTAK